MISLGQGVTSYVAGACGVPHHSDVMVFYRTALATLRGQPQGVLYEHIREHLGVREAVNVKFGLPFPDGRMLVICTDGPGDALPEVYE